MWGNQWHDCTLDSGEGHSSASEEGHSSRGETFCSLYAAVMFPRRFNTLYIRNRLRISLYIKWRLPFTLKERYKLISVFFRLLCSTWGPDISLFQGAPSTQGLRTVCLHGLSLPQSIANFRLETWALCTKRSDRYETKSTFQNARKKQWHLSIPKQVNNEPAKPEIFYSANECSTQLQLLCVLQQRWMQKRRTMIHYPNKEVPGSSSSKIFYSCRSLFRVLSSPNQYTENHRPI
jgi:hypothetical protein